MIACAFAAGHAHADPIHLSRDTYRQVEKINRDVNGSMAIRRADGVGNCVAVAERKYQALDGIIPSHARHTVTVRSPGYAQVLHRMVMIETDRGPIYMDMNSPWLENAKQAQNMGYRPYVVDWGF